MALSYWEYKTWLNNIDFTIVGSGIVGLSCALSLREKYPKAKIVILERGILPNGASTKNAGFACFGSVSEILDDLRSHSEEEVVQLVKKRVKGLELLRKQLGDKNIGFQQYGGYEIFRENDTNSYEECLLKLPYINNLLKEAIFSKNDVFLIKNNLFSFKNIQKNVIFNQYEGQLDTGKMMQQLLSKCQKKGVLILNSIKIDSFLSENEQILLKTDHFGEILTKKLLVATNGFAEELLKKNMLAPARAQVLITKPIKNLGIKGTFHLDKGFYYFRNIDNRILLGGGRNLDFKGETTTEMTTTQYIQNTLEELLKNTILPNKAIEIEYRWSGIMGVGQQKKPIVEKISEHVYCAVRLGGMGVAIGSLVGKELADLASE
ncbi:MAG: FAD-dependent oxidoreductase [Flavobacteriaceae bacterium]